MFIFGCAVLIAGFALASLPGVGRAQLLNDHLKCYKIKDKTKFVAEATLTALQAEFGAEDCKIKGKAKLLCAPVNKDVTTFEDKSDEKFGHAPFAGPDLTFDRICYKLKCPGLEIDALEVTDQFGTRMVEKFKPAMLCTPAIKGQPPVCPMDFTSGACDAYRDDLAPGCKACCDADNDCGRECSTAQDLNCSAGVENLICAATMNDAGCSSVCACN